MPTPSAPTTELGASNPFGPLALPGWNALGGTVDDAELTPALKWPQSIATFELMRNDSQVEALFYATTLPIRRYRWVIDPNGAREELVAKASADYGLPIKGAGEAPIPRYKGRFSFAEHLRLVLQSLLFGHYFFEQYGVIEDDGRWHVRKLAPRAPRIVTEIVTERDGGLRLIKVPSGQPGRTVGDTELKVERLLAYVWDQEPGRWVGRSMLRSIYREWTLKDRLLRVDAMKHERNGMGVPVSKAMNSDVTAAQLRAAQEVAAAWRVGEHASASLPYGVDVELKGVQGNLPDTLASIQRHDEAMSRRWLGMLIQLGQTETGSRALGSEFSDLIELGRDAIAGWVCDVFSAHQLEDDADWNFEGETYVPRLAYERDQDVAVEAPPAEEPPVPPPVAASRRRRRQVRASSEIKLPDRDLRRQPYEHEVQAAVDFDALEAVWTSELDGLISDWQDIRAAQIEELQSAIAAAQGDLPTLARLEVQPQGEDLIAERMQAMYEEGQRTAGEEAQAQGVQASVMARATGDREQSLLARAAAAAVLLGRSLAEAAARKAIELSGGGLDEEAVAERTATHLDTLTDAYLRDQLGGALTASLNAGRIDTMRATQATTVYASELLDENTCGPCTEIDGEEFDSIDAAEESYPTGGYVDCEGGPRCRGTVVATYDEG